MEPRYITYTLNGLLMIGMPIALGIFLTRRWQSNWRLFWIGALTFIASQIGHIPFNSYVLTPLVNNLLRMLPNSQPDVTIATASTLLQVVIIAIMFGLSSGLFEELARYIAYARFLPDERSWRKGLLLGAGHGGIEAIIFGFLVLLSLLNLILLRRPAIFETVPVEQQALVSAQLEAYWSAPLPMTLLGAVERALTIPFHLAMSLLVLQVFVTGQRRWVFSAIFLHAASNATALIFGFVFRGQSWRAYAVEGMIAIFTIAALLIIRGLYRSEPTPEDEPAAPKLEPLTEIPKIDNARPEDLEDSKFL